MPQDDLTEMFGEPISVYTDEQRTKKTCQNCGDKSDHRCRCKNCNRLVCLTCYKPYVQTGRFDPKKGYEWKPVFCEHGNLPSFLRVPLTQNLMSTR